MHAFRGHRCSAALALHSLLSVDNPCHRYVTFTRSPINLARTLQKCGLLPLPCLLKACCESVSRIVELTLILLLSQKGYDFHRGVQRYN